MATTLSLPWLALLLLGAGHGINPAMGWLFAVAQGLQERTGSAVWRTLLPLALGHALAIAAVLGAAVLIGLVIPPDSLKWVVAAVLFGFGVYRLIRQRHPRWGGMRVGPRDLTVWSFLMASAHGAGLMVLPFVLGGEPGGHTAHLDLLAPGIAGERLMVVAATLIHTAGYLLVTGAVAAIVYHKLGLRLLRTAWINLDLIWTAALIVTAVLTPLL